MSDSRVINGGSVRKKRVMFTDGLPILPMGRKASGGMFIAVLLLILLSVRALAASSAPAPVQGDDSVKTAPVIIDGTTLFSVRGIRAYPAEERAAVFRERIIRVAAGPGIPVNAITAVEADNKTIIVADSSEIMTIVDADAALEGITRQQMAEVYVRKIRAAIQEYRHARSRESIVRGVLYACAATIALLIMIFLVARLFRRLHSALESSFKEKLSLLDKKSLNVFGAEGIWAAVEDALKTVRFVIVFALFYIYIESVLRFFPWTRFFAKKLFDYVLDPLKILGSGVMGQIPDLIFIVVLVIIVRLFLKVMHIFFKEIELGARMISGFLPEWAKPTDRLLTFGVIAFAVVVAFPYIPGSGTAAFKGISIFIGVLFSLGSQSTVSNTIAGFIVQYRRAFRVGDRIRINDVIGDVAAMRMQVTILRTIKNEEVIVPNSAILSSHIVNYSSLAHEKGLILHTEVTIGYDAPWRQVHAMLLMAAERTSGLLKNPPPFVLQKGLEDFYVRYELNAYTDSPGIMANIYSELHKNIQDSFNEYGVQIMSPHYLGDPASAKIVPKEKWSEPPADSASQ